MSGVAAPSANALRMRERRAALTAAGLTTRGKAPTAAYAARLDWQAIVPEAARIVRSYSTPVTLRQLFYQLVARQIIPNTPVAYGHLSRYTAQARRYGTFPALIEGGRIVHEPQTFDDADDAREWLASIYRRDRTEGQDVQIILGVEKAGMIEQLTDWFEDLGVPIFAASGYSSVTLEAKLKRLASRSRSVRTVLIYAGDFDPSGEDIVRNLAFNLRTITVVQVGLNEDQVVEYDLPENETKEQDPRTAAFVARHPLHPSQVELDALDPNTLRDLYQTAIDRYWDPDAYDAALAQEAIDRAELVR